MNIIGVIPARWASTRFPGKVLADICGKPMIQHIWEQAKKSRLLTEVYIACDDDNVLKVAGKFGAQVRMTSPKLASGTDRIADAVRDINADIILNIQGDEPLIKPEVIDRLAQALCEHDAYSMATGITVIHDEADLHNPNVVKVVIDENNDALYFSRSVIPFNRDKRPFNTIVYYKHLGIYAYRKEFLMRFTHMPPARLEQAEQLEQLRALEEGVKIKTVQTQCETVSVDTPDDLKQVVSLMEAKR